MKTRAPLRPRVGSETKPVDTIPIASAWWLLPILLAVLAATYFRALNGSMLWDDDAHLVGPALRSWHGLWRIWFDVGATQQYYPVTFSLFWIQHRLWGDAFLGYHLVNLTLHAVSAVLLATILRTLRIPGAVLAAVVFAVHPVQVESVAWMTELKNTLSGVFYFAAALSFFLYCESSASRHRAFALGFYVLALLSKSVTATLPIALLVVIWWRAGRLRIRREVRTLLALMIVLGACSGLATTWIERMQIGARGAEFALGPIERGLIAGRAVVFYASTLAWPFDLTFFYPRWDIRPDVWWQYLFPLAVAGLLGVFASRRRTRSAFVAALLYIVALAPALGFVNVYPFRYSFVADHFQYLACAAVFVSVSAALLGALVSHAPLTAATAELALCLAIGAPLAVRSHAEAAKYTNAQTLYAVTLHGNPSCWLCQENLAILAVQRTPPDRDEAVARLREALRIRPTEPQVHNNLGTTLMELGHLDEAVLEYQAAIRFAPGYAEAYENLGAALQKLGRFAEAIEAYRTALEIKPGLTEARANLSVALQEAGRPDEAAQQLREAARVDRTMDPSSLAEKDVRLGDAAAAIGHAAEAVDSYRRALSIGPDAPLIHYKLALALWQAGHVREAETELREVIRRTPGDPDAHASLAGLLLTKNDLPSAVGEFTASLRARPDAASVHNDLGVTLARLGRQPEAIAHFREALRLQPGYSAARANLSKALGK